MEKKVLKARAEIPQREWVEFEVTLTGDTIQEVLWHAQGCHLLLEEAEKFAQDIKSKKLGRLSHSIKAGANHHGHLLMSEILDKLTGHYQVPEDIEICHCRIVKRSVIDQAIVLGAHTPEKVTAWTSASSGCGTCRPEVQKLIDLRLGGLKKAA